MKIVTYTSGNGAQITIDRMAQITASEGEITIDLSNPSLCVTKEGGRLTISLNPRLAFVAPEARGSVAEDLGLKPFALISSEAPDE